MSLIALNNIYKIYNVGGEEVRALDGINLKIDENELKANLVANNLVNTWKLANQVVKENGGIFIPVLQPVIYIGNVKKNHILDNLEKDSEANFKIVYVIIKSKSSKVKPNTVCCSSKFNLLRLLF